MRISDWSSDVCSSDLRVEQVDVGDENSVQSAADGTSKAAGAIDILVNSAGITGPNTSVCEYPVAEWDQVMRVNLRGPFLCCRAIAPHMRPHDYGRIVNLASVAGHEGHPNDSAYCAPKSACIALHKSLGKVQ